MSLLFLSKDFFLLFLAWELIGISSLKLIAYYQARVETLRAGMNAITYYNRETTPLSQEKFKKLYTLLLDFFSSLSYTSSFVISGPFFASEFKKANTVELSH